MPPFIGLRRQGHEEQYQQSHQQCEAIHRDILSYNNPQ
jgi:hypothetical protein